MEIEKKHILLSYKNEQRAIEAVKIINGQNENPVTPSHSDPNEERTAEKEFPSNGYNIDIREPSPSDDTAEPVEEPAPFKNNSNDLDRPLPERVINNRIK